MSDLRTISTAQRHTIVALRWFAPAMACHSDGVVLWWHHSAMPQHRSGFVLRGYSAVVLRHCGIATLWWFSVAMVSWFDKRQPD
jgi:hypothetical protein